MHFTKVTFLSLPDAPSLNTAQYSLGYKNLLFWGHLPIFPACPSHILKISTFFVYSKNNFSKSALLHFLKMAGIFLIKKILIAEGILEPIKKKQERLANSRVSHKLIRENQCNTCKTMMRAA